MIECRHGLAFERGGEGAPLLVLLHGLGATAEVWTPMLAEASRRWPGRWLVADLPGHGGSAPLAGYRNKEYVAALVPLIADEAGEASVTLLGHSLGGGVALAMAAGTYGFRPARVLALGIKIDWTAAELERFEAVAARPARTFESKEEALSWHARQAGLDAASCGPSLVSRGTRQEDGRWRAAMDSKAFAVEPPAMARWVGEAICPVRLACGAADPMVKVERLRMFDSLAIAVPDAGHNAMVDHPAAIWDWLGEPA